MNIEPTPYKNSMHISHETMLSVDLFGVLIRSLAGVGNDFFSRGGGSRRVDLVLELKGGYQGVDYRNQKLTNFDQNSNFSLF